MVKRKTIKGIPLKKKFGQNFLRDHVIVQRIVDQVELDNSSSIFEIGCGDGFLTRAILQKPLARLWVFEIDIAWAEHVKKTINDERMQVRETNILDVDFAIFEEHQPWTLLANLPYQITFPILHRLQRYRHLLKEGVIMVQEEVAQKIVKTSGRGYGYPSVFFQYFFTWQLLDKVSPSSFYPPPKVFSRLLYFKPKVDLVPIPDEERFWKFIKACFKQPRRTLRNNLAQKHFPIDQVPEKFLVLRAQQLAMNDFLYLWDLVRLLPQ